MYLISRRHAVKLYKTVYRCVSSQSGIKKSYYEILNLPRTCTDKEIKEAFVKLSKLYHPDRNNDKNTNDAFIQVMEAYSVLGKPHLRAKYDVRPVYPSNTWNPNTDAASSYGRNTGHRTAHNDYPNYGFHPQQDAAERKRAIRRSNHLVVIVCFGIAVVGFALQMFVIISSAQLSNARANEKSRIAGENLARARAAAILNGNDGQSQAMMEKIAQGAGPREATAALAETLVDTPGKQ